MRTSEFKEAIERLYFTIEDINDQCESELVIRSKISNDILGTISLKTKYDMYVSFEDYPNIVNEEKQKQLFNLFLCYASTPIAEREDEKRYRLELISETITEKCYMGYSKKNKEYKPITFNFLRFNNDRTWKIIFTESELKTMDLTGFKKVEVTD